MSIQSQTLGVGFSPDESRRESFAVALGRGLGEKPSGIFEKSSGIFEKPSGILRLLGFILMLGCLASDASAQFSGSIQGTVLDASGAVIPSANVTLTNIDQNVTRSASTDSSGVYRFPSLAPGNYRVTAQSAGFSKGEATIILSTNETRDVPVTLGAEGVTQGVTVTTEAPLLNTAETRNELTIGTEAFDNLPLPGRSFLGLVALAPGVSGIGTSGSYADNFNTETANDVSANGRGANGNLYVVDGLDITSSVLPGVTNLVPNPDSIAEASIQTNTFSVDYGRASSIQTTITTKSGSDQFHGFASDFFTNQSVYSHTHFQPTLPPFHSNNISAGIGGPIWRGKEAFFFFSIEPLRSSNSTGGQNVTFEDPAFVQFAKTTFPNTVGTKVVSTYGVANVSRVAVATTAAGIFGPTSATPCGTAASSFLPCTTPVIDSGVFNATSFRNAVQYNVRLDKYFKNDRLYGTVYRQHLNTGGPNLRPAFTTNNTSQSQAYQVNETHTFSAKTLNEASAAYLRVEGVNDNTGDFTVPAIGVSGVAGYGVGFAQGDFIQTNYHWRDVFTHIVGNHSVRVGVDGVYYTGDALFATVHTQPNFNFNNILDLVRDQPVNEGTLSYDPGTGKPLPGNYGYASQVNGAFAEDTWKINKRVTLNYGFRVDDFGNSYGADSLQFVNFFPGAGSTPNQQIATGVAKPVSNAFAHRIMGYSPRAGFAYDMFGTGKTVLHGGFGVFHDSPTLRATGDIFNGNPYVGSNGNPSNFVVPTFFNDGSTAPPIFALGTSAAKPAGFPYPAFVGQPLNAQGGITGQQIGLGGIDRNLKTSNTYNYVLTVEQQVTPQIVASVGYVGSFSNNLLTGAGNTANVGYGTDVNRFDGDLFQQTGVLVPGTGTATVPPQYTYRAAPTRLNHSFGAINYIQSLANANYSALVTAVRGRLTDRGFLTASYTYSRSMDDWQVYPTNDFQHFYSRSNWDVPNRFSLGYSYETPGVGSSRLLRSATGGFTLAGTTILQQGGRFTVFTSAAFQPSFGANGVITGLRPSSGDFNGDGFNYDFPNVQNANQQYNRKQYLSGVFPTCGNATTGSTPFGTPGSPCGQFSLPALGAEGNEIPNGFRNPGYADWDLNVKRSIKLYERLSVDVRFDVFNLFNRVNLQGVDGNASDGNYGRANSQYPARNMDLGARINF